MQESLDISWVLMGLFSLTLVIPFTINRIYQLDLAKEMGLSVFRMVAQLAFIGLGASPHYATLPFVRAAMQKAFAPIMASMATTGLVTLPGMMTGQILGGVNPMVAIKYQLLILIAIFVMLTISVTITLQLTIKNSITKEGKVLVSLSAD